MHHFDYRDGELYAEAVNLATVARTVGTPFYCYSTATLERHYRVFAEAFADVKAIICYAMKANSNQSVLKTFARLGAGADVVSGGELKRALAAGISPDKILFSGVGKTAQELRMALDAGILSINVESESELELLSQIAANEGRTARISMRVNPDVDAKTHAKIATGKSENKFGVPLVRAREIYARAARLPNIVVTGVDMHIGSQITDLQPLADAFNALADFVRVLRADGHNISHIDFGGGLGIPYHADQEAPPDPKAYAEVVKRAVKGLDCTLLFEPGRLLVGNAGILVTRVLYLKPGEAKNFVIVDAAMNDLVRPTLYEAHHDILTVKQAPEGAPTFVADIVGPVCESGDYMAKNRALSEPKEGDLLAIMSAGAYGAVQAGTYNTRALVPEVLVKEDRYAVVRPRVEVEDIIALDRDAPWLGNQ
jgi:diaminopimelate decarboxylase